MKPTNNMAGMKEYEADRVAYFYHLLPEFTERRISMSKEIRSKSYDELRFCDDFMFRKVMEDAELCREVLECLLQRPVGKLTEVQTEKEMHFVSDGKPIRLDVYNEDSDKNVYDVEMQNLNRKTVEWHALPERSRFYQSAIDNDYIDKNESYKDLPESRVMFICTFDPFGKGLGQYTFRECCIEDRNLELGDGTTKIFYNCTYEGNDLPEEIRDLYDYIENGHVKGDLAGKIDGAVTKAKNNAKWRSEYVKARVLLMDAKEEGREEAWEEARIERDRLNAEIERLRKENEKLRKMQKSVH